MKTLTVVETNYSDIAHLRWSVFIIAVAMIIVSLAIASLPCNCHDRTSTD
jgi:hypothetical protein